MSEPVFQYQRLAEPLFTGPEFTGPDKWQPTLALPTPTRRFQYQSLAEPVFPPAAVETITLDKWFQEPAAPPRRPAARGLLTYTAPVFPVTAAEVVTLDKWFHEQPGPGRPRPRPPEPGGFRVDPTLFVVPPLDWNRFHEPLPVRLPPPHFGFSVEPVFVPPPPPVPDFFGVQPVVPPRPRPRYVGTFYVEPMGPQGPTPPPVALPLSTAGRANKPLIERDPDAPTPRSRRITEKLSEIVNSLAGQGMLFQTGPNTWAVRPRSFEDVRTPSANDDERIGAFPGALWVDLTTQDVYVCITNAESAAVWKKLT